MPPNVKEIYLWTVVHSNVSVCLKNTCNNFGNNLNNKKRDPTHKCLKISKSSTWNQYLQLSVRILDQKYHHNCSRLYINNQWLWAKNSIIFNYEFKILKWYHTTLSLLSPSKVLPLREIHIYQNICMDQKWRYIFILPYWLIWVQHIMI